MAAVDAGGGRKKPTSQGGPNRTLKITVRENEKGAKAVFPLDLAVTNMMQESMMYYVGPKEYLVDLAEKEVLLLNGCWDEI